MCETWMICNCAKSQHFNKLINIDWSHISVKNAALIITQPGSTLKRLIYTLFYHFKSFIKHKINTQLKKTLNLMTDNQMISVEMYWSHQYKKFHFLSLFSFFLFTEFTPPINCYRKNFVKHMFHKWLLRQFMNIRKMKRRNHNRVCHSLIPSLK